MNYPDIVGFELNTAIEILTEWDQSVPIKKIETVSSKKTHQLVPEETRVVNQVLENGSFVLTIAYF